MANLRFFLYCVFGVLAIWFLTMGVDIFMFMHTDVDDLVSGSVPISFTDIADRCGSEYVNSASLVDFKLSTKTHQIIFLCPPGISPIRSKVTAITLPDRFRRALAPPLLLIVTQYYPVLAAPLPVPTAPVTTAPAATSNATPDASATPAVVAPTPAPAPAPAMSNAPPPVENNSKVTDTPAVPADN